MVLIRKYWWLFVLNEVKGVIIAAPLWVAYFHWIKGAF